MNIFVYSGPRALRRPGLFFILSFLTINNYIGEASGAGISFIPFLHLLQNGRSLSRTTPVSMPQK